MKYGNRDIEFMVDQKSTWSTVDFWKNDYFTPFVQLNLFKSKLVNKLSIIDAYEHVEKH